jgi:hypothetical protein
MSWAKHILEQARPGALLHQLDELFSSQRADWPLLAAGVHKLAGMITRDLIQGSDRIRVQSNPGRAGSTHAKVDPKSVAERPCFLCPQNMPAEERGIAFDELIILPNPYPILAKHCTVPAREHSPQRLSGNVQPMLDLARALGPTMLVFYNGPRCGASAPDHLHFQACQAEGVPLLESLPKAETDGMWHGHESFGRRMLVGYFADPAQAADRVENCLHTLADLLGEKQEPMVSLLTRPVEGRYAIVLFPRAKHRPNRYFEKDPHRLAISPATLEMAGLLVVAEPEHFERVDAPMAKAIYREVSLGGDRFRRLLEALA